MGVSKLRGSVESLETIYAVVVALAVTKAIEGILFSSSSGYADYKLLFNHLPELIAFFITIVPFYQGMHRHLNGIYLEGTGPTKQGFLLLDFLVFFLESCILLVFASSLSLGINAFQPLIMLLFIDSIWAILAHFIHYHKWGNSPGKWALINAVFIIIMFPILFPVILLPESGRLWILTALAIIRTTTDYIVCWNFYFPKD